jgi:thiamine biosynthesis lipoprotein
MGMPVTLEVVDAEADEELFEAVFAYFDYVDRKFSTYKADSEISLLNRGELTLEEASEDMKTVFELADQIRELTHGFFDIRHGDSVDPSGLVKGWAIFNASELVRQRGFKNYYVEAGGDFQAVGKNSQGQDWRVGIRSPFDSQEIVKVLEISNGGVATSGTYVRGAHIYNPKSGGKPVTDIVSLTVIGPDIFTADCFATAAFAMGKEGIHFIENLAGFEGYMIDNDRRATFTSGFSRYCNHA